MVKRPWKSTLRHDSSKKPPAGSGDQGPNHKPPHPCLGAVPHHLKNGLDIIIVDGSFDILSFLSVPWVKLCLTTIRTPAAL